MAGEIKKIYQRGDRGLGEPRSEFQSLFLNCPKTNKSKLGQTDQNPKREKATT
jgi:hypothetical protein